MQQISLFSEENLRNKAEKEIIKRVAFLSGSLRSFIHGDCENIKTDCICGFSGFGLSVMVTNLNIDVEHPDLGNFTIKKSKTIKELHNLRKVFNKN